MRKFKTVGRRAAAACVACCTVDEVRVPAGSMAVNVDCVACNTRAEASLQRANTSPLENRSNRSQVGDAMRMFEILLFFKYSNRIGLCQSKTLLINLCQAP